MNKPVGFYVTMIRSSKQKAWLLGPFPTKDAAEANVQTARVHMTGMDPFAHFDGFGVARLEKRTGALPAGRLNREYPELDYRGVEVSQ